MIQLAKCRARNTPASTAYRTAPGWTSGRLRPRQAGSNNSAAIVRRVAASSRLTPTPLAPAAWKASRMKIAAAETVSTPAVRAKTICQAGGRMAQIIPVPSRKGGLS